jgi:4-oxalocrotonate tautomerase
MPLVRIDLAEGKSPEHRKRIGEIVYNAMRETINVPADDKFQIIAEHPLEEMNFPSSYLGIEYSHDLIIIQMTISQGRTVELKQALYKRINDDLHAQLKIRREDVFINVVEVVKENWSFGNGVAQYV